MFQVSQEYRRQEIHDQIGGQRQGGISTPAKHAIVLLFTGSSGEAHG
jgi:5-methylcytosine-specific restriction enzyme A